MVAVQKIHKWKKISTKGHKFWYNQTVLIVIYNFYLKHFFIKWLEKMIII